MTNATSRLEAAKAIHDAAAETYSATAKAYEDATAALHNAKVAHHVACRKLRQAALEATPETNASTIPASANTT